MVETVPVQLQALTKMFKGRCPNPVDINWQLGDRFSKASKDIDRHLMGFSKAPK